MPRAAFEPAIPTSERQQTHALDRAVTWIGIVLVNMRYRRTQPPCNALLLHPLYTERVKVQNQG
jgi:hypothetical protein